MTRGLLLSLERPDDFQGHTKHMTITEEADQPLKNTNAVMLAVADGDWRKAAEDCKTLLAEDPDNITVSSSIFSKVLSTAEAV